MVASHRAVDICVLPRPSSLQQRVARAAARRQGFRSGPRDPGTLQIRPYMILIHHQHGFCLTSTWTSRQKRKRSNATAAHALRGRPELVDARRASSRRSHLVWCVSVLPRPGSRVLLLVVADGRSDERQSDADERGLACMLQDSSLGKNYSSIFLRDAHTHRSVKTDAPRTLAPLSNVPFLPSPPSRSLGRNVGHCPCRLRPATPSVVRLGTCVGRPTHGPT